ncbi:uncharacterized protein IWZ02DRAFT_454476 [Phyllosticta citriasiana]|uniref:uncharacterized protein n=1 Tax=Phyllosticta citriasiana TaxID=595635 RepID=UPI0030FDE859
MTGAHQTAPDSADIKGTPTLFPQILTHHLPFSTTPTMGPPAADAVSEVFSMLELDPAPVDDDFRSTRADGARPTSSWSAKVPAPSSSPMGSLGLSGHSPVFYLTRIQKYSSYAFTLFAAAHITNTSLIPLATRSLPASDTYLLLTRPYYQDFPFEQLLVIAPLALHIASGLALRLYRRRQTVRRYAGEASTRSERRRVPWPAVSGTSALGFASTLLVGGHAFVNRCVPLLVEGSSAGIGLEYVSHAFSRHPALAFVGFGALVAATVWHGVWGAAKWNGWTPAQLVRPGAEGEMRRKRRWYVINGIAAALAGLWMWGGLGMVGQGGPATGWVARDYDNLFKSIPLVGQWL